MHRRTAVFTVLGLAVAPAAFAQSGGGGGGRGRGGRGGQRPDSSAPSAGKPPSAPAGAEKPVSEIDMFGVVSAIDPQTQRITIAYEANDTLNLPKGEQPFEVSKTELMTGVTVGERVRFRIDSHQISYLTPWKPADPAAP